MPIYEYICENCGEQTEAIQKFSDAPLTDCPACQKSTLKKKASMAAFHLKGGGWYKDGYSGITSSSDSSTSTNSSNSSGTSTNSADSKTTESKKSDTKVEKSSSKDTKPSPAKGKVPASKAS